MERSNASDSAIRTIDSQVNRRVAGSRLVAGEVKTHRGAKRNLVRAAVFEVRIHDVGNCIALREPALVYRNWAGYVGKPMGNKVTPRKAICKLE
jgi:hypothetical protein